LRCLSPRAGRQPLEGLEALPDAAIIEVDHCGKSMLGTVAQSFVRLLFVWVGLGSVFVAGQPRPKPDVSTSVNLIEVPIVVRDKHGKNVGDLSLTDFKIYDDGRLQKIKFFRFVTPHSARSASGETSNATARNAPSDVAADPPRYILIVLPLNTFGSRGYSVQAILKAVKSGIFDGDFVALVDSAGVVLPFTRDHDAIVRAATEMSQRKASSCSQTAWYPVARDLLLQLKPSSGRKFVVMFSDPDALSPCWNWSPFPNSPDVLVRAALSANAAIYPVDPRGPEPVLPLGDASTPNAFGGASSAATFDPGSAGVSGSMIANRMSGRLSSLAGFKGLFQDVAHDTGGRALVGHNDLDQVFQMVQQGSRYYEVGYYLPNLQANGLYHRIAIAVNRKGLRLQARPGYFAPMAFGDLSRAGKRDWLYQALQTGVPLDDIQIDAHADFFPNPPGAAADVPISYDMRWWVPQETAKRRHWIMTVGLVQDARTGATVGNFSRTNSWDSHETEPQENGYVHRDARYNLLVRLTGGVYQLKIAVADLDSNLVGSDAFRLEVPAAAMEPFATSSLILADTLVPLLGEQSEPVQQFDSSSSELAPTSDPLAWTSYHLVPSVQPVFGSSSALTLFARVYPSDRIPKAWQATAVIRDSSGKIVAGPIALEIPGSIGRPAGIPVGHTFNLKDLRLADGVYSAEIQLAEQDAGRREKTVSRHFVIASEHQP